MVTPTYLCGLLALLVLAAAQFNDDDASNYWINPPPSSGTTGTYARNPTFSVGSVISLQWKSSWSSLLVRVNQDVQRGNTYSDIASNIANTGSIQWTVQVPPGMNLTETPVFWFTIFDEGGSDKYVLSHYFNISKATSTQVSVSTQTTIVSQIVTVTGAALASTNTTLPTMTPTSTNKASTNEQESTHTTGGLSGSAKVGIGIGVSLGILCLILAIVAGWLLSRKRRNKSFMVANSFKDGDGSATAGAMSQRMAQEPTHDQKNTVIHYHELVGQPGPVYYEMNAQQPYYGHELPGEH